MTSTKLFKECNFKAVKAKENSRWTLAFHETIESAKSWIAPCEHYAIHDVRGGEEKLVESQNWDLETDRPIWLDPEEETVNTERVEYNG